MTGGADIAESAIVHRLVGHVRIYRHLLTAYVRETNHIGAIQRLMKTTPDGEMIARGASQPIIRAAAEIRRSLIEERRLIRKDARALPVYPWVKSVKGAGELNLGLIVGSAGDLSRYSNPAKLWKRFGLGLLPTGERQRKFKDPDMAKLAGFCPQRRAVMHVLGGCLLKQNDGEFRELYDQRKQYELDRDPEMQPMKAHMRALRCMEKRFLRELWRRWHG